MATTTDRRPVPRRTAALLLSALLAAACSSPPSVTGTTTDLYLVEVWTERTLMALRNPVNLTYRLEYDNQPCFLPSGEAFLYVSRSEGRTDIHRFELATLVSSQLTSTALENEYSPCPIPGEDALSAVRVERGGNSRLMRIASDGAEATPLTDLIDESVQYYAWGDAGLIAVTTETDTPELRVVDLRAGTVETIATRVGRSVQSIPGRRAISFLHKPSVADWWIVELDLATLETKRLVRAIQGREDHAWTPAGRLLMAKESEIYWWEPSADDGWQLLADLSRAGLRDISRMAVSPDGSRMVLVADSEPARD